MTPSGGREPSAEEVTRALAVLSQSECAVWCDEAHHVLCSSSCGIGWHLIIHTIRLATMRFFHGAIAIHITRARVFSAPTIGSGARSETH